MKNTLTFLSISILLFLFSCKPEKESKFVIGVSQCSDDLWRQTMNKEMLREASFYQNIELKTKSVKDNTEQQIKDIESLIEDGVDLLVISPNESAAVTPIVQKAYKAGIPVILVDRKIDTDDYTAFVGADNYQIGKEAGIYSASVLNGRGNIVEIRGWNGSTSDTERHSGFIDGIKNFPDIHVVAQRRGNFLKKEAEKQMSEILKEHNQIDLVFAMNDPMALGVHNAVLNYSGRFPFIIGIDALSGEGGGIQNIQNGLQDASFIYPTGGDKVIDLAHKILNHENYKKENILYTAVVDKSNVRVIQLQTDQIFEHQEKLEKMNKALDQSLAQYSNQTTLFYVAILALIFISLSLFISYMGYRAKSRANLKLEKSNEEIKEQATALAQQKEQLISLSRELEEATQAKLVFFTNISHELKTPLTLILGPVDTLLASDNLVSEEKELLNLVKRNSERLSRLIIQIIEFRSYENGKMKAYFSRNDMGSFLEDLSSPFFDFAKRKNVDFHFQTDSSDFTMCFDKEKIEKIYFNLLSNAFKYTEIYGHIDVNLTKIMVENKSCAKLTVFNTGKAIPEDQIKNIFKRFYKVNPHDVGTGIGLALTSALVDVHNGSITVDSIDNVGSTFSVTLPFEQEDVDQEVELIDYYQQTDPESILTSSTEPSTDESNNMEESKPTILVVEDNADVRNYIRNILKHDYTILESSDGQTGIDKAIELSPDVIISDIMMPNKDGFEVCQTLKENLSTSHIPIILLTACNLDEQRAMGFESGADAYIPKPFNAELLKIRIRKLIQNRQKIKEAYIKNLINGTNKTIVADLDQGFLNDFQAYIESCISDSELNVDEIARKMGLSRSQLYRKIKSLTNYSPIELIKILRLRYAANLLLSSKLSISEIAYESGFSSPSYFTKCFKEFYKENPTDYVKNLS